MAPFVAGLLRAAADAFPLPAPVLQFGSYRPDASVLDFRTLFPGRPCLGIDERPGRGVDLVCAADALPVQSQSAGCFIALNALVHVCRFWHALEQMRRVLRPDGALLVCAPFHARPNPSQADYWRFTPDAFEMMLQPAFPQRVVGWHGSPKRPLHVWAIAFGPDAPPVGGAQLRHFGRCLDRHARAPLPLAARLRGGVVRLLGGRRSAEGFFLRNRWGMEYHGPDAASALAA